MEMTDYEDYENNLAFPPTTDRTQSKDELVEKIKKLEQQIKEANKIILSFDRLVGELTGTVFQNVLDYYKKYNVSRKKEEFDE